LDIVCSSYSLFTLVLPDAETRFMLASVHIHNVHSDGRIVVLLTFT